MAPFAPPQPIRAFPWDHSVSYFIHLISTLKTDYKQFPQNHSWLTVLPFIFADGLPIILFLRFSWLQPTQSGHLERIHLISQATCHRLTGADSSSIQSSRPNYSSLAASLQEAISQNLLRYQFPWFALPFNGTLLSLSSSSTIAFKTFANLHIPLRRTKQPISSTSTKMHIKMHIVILASLIVPWSTLYPSQKFLTDVSLYRGDSSSFSLLKYQIIATRIIRPFPVQEMSNQLWSLLNQLEIID